MKKEYDLEDLEKILDNIPYEFALCNNNGKYIYVNNTFANNLHLSKEDMIGKTPDEVIGKLYSSIASFKHNNKNVFTETKSPLNDKWYDLYKFTIHNNGKTFFAFIANGLNMNMTRVYNNLYYTKEKNSMDLLGYSDILYDHNNILSDTELKKGITLLCEDLQHKVNIDGISIYLIDSNSNDINLFIKTGYNLEDYESLKKLLFEKPYEHKKYNKNTLLNSHPQNCKLLSNKNSNSNWQLSVHPIKYSSTCIGLMILYYNDINNIKFTVDDLINLICHKLGIVFKNRNMTIQPQNKFKKNIESMNNLDLTFNTSREIQLMIKSNGTIAKVSKSLLDALQFSNTELINTKYHNLLHPDDIALIQEYYHFKNKTSNVNIINRLKCRDGSYKFIQWYNIVNTDNASITLSGKDITIQHQLQEENKKIYAELELENSKLEFFSNMSHEFRTPLNIILNSSQLMDIQFKNKDFEKAQTNLKYIRQNSYRLLKLTNNILDTSRIDYGAYDLNFENCNIVEVIENIVTSVVGYIKSFNKNIIFDTDQEEILISCDINIIERIMLNLLSNAIKYVNKNGNIEVKLSLDKTNNCVLVSVWDDGISISKENSKKIFGKYNRIDNSLTRSYEGGGLGLFLTKSLVEIHKGKIWVNTKVKKGAEIIFSLPIQKISKNKSKIIKPLDTKIEKCNIELSDIYSLY